MDQPKPRRKASARELASRALFRSSGAIACAIGQIGVRGAGGSGDQILVVQLGDIGDLVLTSPFLRELGRFADENNRELTLVVKPSVKSLAERCPYAGRVIPFDARRSRFAGALSGLVNARRFARAEFAGEFEIAWNPRFDLDELGATFLMLYSAAARKVGYSEHVSPSKELRNHGYDCLLDLPVRPTPGASRHEADRLLDLLTAEGIPTESRNLELWLESDDEVPAEGMLSAVGSRAPVALGIGAGHPKRCWPVQRFAKVAERLYQEHGAIAVLVGGPTERPAAAEISAAARVPVIDAVGHLPLRATAALIRKCAIYVGNDSGLLHISAAAGLPVVEISCHPLGGNPEHPNAPERFGPYGVQNVVLQPPHPAATTCVAGCEAQTSHCIEGVEVDSVLDGAVSMLREAKWIPS